MDMNRNDYSLLTNDGGAWSCNGLANISCVSSTMTKRKSLEREKFHCSLDFRILRLAPSNDGEVNMALVKLRNGRSIGPKRGLMLIF